MNKNSKQALKLKEKFQTDKTIKLKEEIRTVKIKLYIIFVVAIAFVSVIIYLK